ncbi:MAG: ATP-binding cassette domain-containing protein [Pelagibacterales bacterium]|nr:ATP-binding cassette domain-containing protein [Pelagibacterales bacterium]
MSLVKLENISLNINDQQIIDRISITLTKGQITTLIGPNGGGKTSIARILLGVLKPSSGSIKKEANIKIGYMPQKIEVERTIPLSVENFLKLSTKKVVFNDYIKNVISRLQIDKILQRQIHTLSGGQMQKVVFLRSIINKPDLLVLDEPTQYMDLNATEEFYQIIDEIRKSQNCAILLISHDLHTVMQKTDSIFCVNIHICCHGSPEDINQHHEYLSLFGKRSNLAIYQHHHDHKH